MKVQQKRQVALSFFTPDGKLKSDLARERILKEKKDKVTESHSLRQLMEARELDYVTRELSAVEVQEQEWLDRLKQT